MLSSTKVIFLGMDAGDKFLIQQWAADGTLPTLRTLLNKGRVGETISLPGFFEGSTWPSFYTGVTPAQHGFHWLTQLIPGTYKFQRCYPGEFIKCQPFWHYLSAAGRKIAILDIPLSGISRGLNGIHMVEWGSHDGVYGFRTWPSHLRMEVLTRFGRHPLWRPCDSIGRRPQDFYSFKNKLLKGIQRKAELTVHYLKKGGWDFFAQVFSESHCVGHQCWHLHDENHPNYDEKMSDITGNPIKEVYTAIDNALGEILAWVDEKTIVIFLASHRMAPYFGAQFLLSDILISLNVAKPLSKESHSKNDDEKKSIRDFLKWGWRRTPTPFKDRFKPILYPIINWVSKNITEPSSAFFKIDPRNSSCFILYNGTVSGLRFNLLGREPDGILKSGAELEAFCNELSRDLMEIIDYSSGKPIVKNVIRTTNLYQGNYINLLPDLLVEWNEEIVPGSESSGSPHGKKTLIFSEKIGLIEGVNSYCRTGDHRPEGLFVAYGPHIEAGCLEKTVSIMDFAPTITKLLGIELSNVDGSPILDIL